jgi:UDP-N-acetyl-D-mannosaminuronic acid dehydrogenase
MKNITVLGLGYIGLPAAALLANKGFKVLGIDIDEKIIHTINQGKIHIVEPKLEKLVYKAVKNNNLIASLNIKKSDVFIVAVPTPFHSKKLNKNTNTPKPNIDYVINAIEKIITVLEPGNLILIESTIPVGTTEIVAKLIKSRGFPLENFFLAHSPERVLPGNIIYELINNDRIVGGIDSKSTKQAARFYNSFILGNVYKTESRTAEMAKLTENAFRDLNIAFANEISMLCNELKINALDLINLANKHPRVNILQPGCGVGGHCIAVDPWFIVDKSNGKAKLIQQARETNISKTNWVLKKIRDAIKIFTKNHSRNPYVAIMGITFKPDVDDLRESPALNIYKKLRSKFKNIYAHDPYVPIYENFEFIHEKDFKKIDIFIYLVAHKQFKEYNLRESDLDFCGISR